MIRYGLCKLGCPCHLFAVAICGGLSGQVAGKSAVSTKAGVASFDAHLFLILPHNVMSYTILLLLNTIQNEIRCFNAMSMNMSLSLWLGMCIWMGLILFSTKFASRKKSPKIQPLVIAQWVIVSSTRSHFLMLLVDLRKFLNVFAQGSAQMFPPFLRSVFATNFAATYFILCIYAQFSGIRLSGFSNGEYAFFCVLGGFFSPWPIAWILFETGNRRCGPGFSLRHKCCSPFCHYLKNFWPTNCIFFASNVILNLFLN